MYPLASAARPLFMSALLIFVVTIVIGILNGMDLWNPSHNVLLTHVHAGTLGWITLAVVGTGMLMFGEGADDQILSRAKTLANVTIVSTFVYVIAFLTTTGLFRPFAGTLLLLAILWALWWLFDRYSLIHKTVSRLALLLAMVSLAIGAVLGVLLGLFIARGSIPGMSNATAASVAGAHPPAMLIGYLILAGVAITHWLLDGPEKMAGRIIAWSLFVAGILVNISFIFDIDALIQISSLLEVVAIVWFIALMWPAVKPSSWRADGDAYARLSVLGLGVGIALLVYVVQLFVSGTLDPETGEGPVGVLLAFDHAMFIGVMTNVLFAVVGRLGAGAFRPTILLAVNGGLVLFLLGLVTDTTLLKQVGSPVMGVGLLVAIWLYARSLGFREVATA